MQRDKPHGIELLKKYRDLENIARRAGVPPSLLKSFRKEVTNRIGQDKSVIEKRLAGLEVEDEFLLMALILGNVEQITPLDQKQFVNWEKYGVPDYLLSVLVPKQFTTGKRQMVQKCLVEVKKAKEKATELVIPVEILSKLRMFSKLYGLPLYFAVKINGLQLSQWFLLAASSIDILGKKVRAKVRREEEDCISVPILEMPKEDFSGLWLSNYSVLIPKGFTICKKYRDQSDGIITNPSYGKLAEVEVSLEGAEKLAISLKRGMPTEQLLLHAVVENLVVGKRRVENVVGGTDVIYETEVNYWIPFYNIVLVTYLDLREKFEPIIAKPPNPKPNIGYFLQAYSQFDRNLTASLRSAVWEMHYRNLVLPIKMLPGTMFDRAQPS